MPRNPASASSTNAARPSPGTPAARLSPISSPNPSLFTRLRQLLTGADADTPARIEEAIAELARAHAAAAQQARAARAAHERAILQGLAEEDAVALDASRAQAAAAAAHEAELSTALAHLQQRLAQVREAAARARWHARWNHAQELMEQRSEAMARLQAASDLYAQTLQEAVAASEAVWAALPVLPAHRPATYGRDLYARANLYLYGATDGKCGSAGLSPHAARQRPGLLDLDDGAREILLLPLTAAQADEAIARAARPIHPGGEDPARLPGA